jgi:cyclase
MLKARVIPCILLNGSGLVKTIQFKKPKYVGDPINAVRIFNDKEVDELTVLDINAMVEEKTPQFEMISNIASECFMPLSYGGGVSSIDQIEKLLKFGVEKVILNSAAIHSPELIKQSAVIVGSQSIVVSIDVKRSAFGKYYIYTHGGKKKIDIDVVEHATHMEKLGAGELLLTSIDRDGTQDGYDLKLLKNVTDAVSIPVIASGGAGKLADFEDAIKKGGASAFAAGSMFVFYGKHRAVLINYPSQEDLKKHLP